MALFVVLIFKKHSSMLCPDLKAHTEISKSQNQNPWPITIEEISLDHQTAGRTINGQLGSAAASVSTNRERLAALEECRDLGQGFQLAERDMAIRSFGKYLWRAKNRGCWKCWH
ncbi:hypothetical protein Fot_14420 [Forsythia ovata]|uniref:Uncharacterized protein n=1 Tax=Forsythia ovata TaxID=205694 RepID=A0ABD1W6A2_9LAMI